MLLFTAFITGLLGSLHCIGMCGPIALAVPVTGGGRQQRIMSRAIYNAGRIATYALLGLLCGTFGFGLKLAGMQQTVSIVAGSLVMLMALFSTNIIERYTGKFFSAFKGKFIGKLFRQKNYRSVFLIGAVNGLLPCGFVYIALTASVATQHAITGALFMALFGAGTTPLMFATGMAGQFLGNRLRAKLARAVPAFTLALGAIMILRGLSLGVPYLSPEVSENRQSVKECCKPSPQTPAEPDRSYPIVK